jgi:hypothetical protein
MPDLSTLAESTIIPHKDLLRWLGATKITMTATQKGIPRKIGHLAVM